MRELIAFVAITSFATTPLQAAAWGMIDSRSSAFAGAQLRIPLGRGSITRPKVSLALAPMASRQTPVSQSIRIGEGIAVSLAGKKPELNIGGIRADRAFRIVRGDSVDAEQKSGISTGAAIGIGVGIVAIGAVALFIAKRTCIGEDPDFCGSD